AQNCKKKFPKMQSMNPLLWKFCRSCIHMSRRGMCEERKRVQFKDLYSREEGIPRDFLSWLYMPLDFSMKNLRRIVAEHDWKKLKASHRFTRLRHDILGPELATAHFVIGKDGAVKLSNSDKWHRKTEEGVIYLPNRKVEGLYVEGIDASDTTMMYESFDNLVFLKNLKFLNLSGCKYIDDFCLSRLHVFKQLKVLDVSNCPEVSERGLATLHNVPTLQRLFINNLPKLGHKAGLVQIHLEDMLPKCQIVSNIDYTDINVIDNAAELEELEELEGNLYERFNTNHVLGNVQKKKPEQIEEEVQKEPKLLTSNNT
ncbi:unnamed protein product, partial [Owenia fusiformis]